MAATTINVTTAAGSRVLFVNEIKRFVTKGTGTQITIGTAEGRGTFTEDIDATESLATVVNLIGNAFLPLTVYTTTSTGVVTYYPILAIRGVEVATNAIAAVNSRVLVASANGRGTFVDGVLVGETVAQVTELLNDSATSDSKFLEVAWTATMTVDLTPYLNTTNSLFLNFVGATQATTALTLTGLIPPNFDIKLLFNANTTLTVTLNAANVIAAAGASSAWTNTDAIVGAFNLFEITAIGDNVSAKNPVLITKHTLA